MKEYFVSFSMAFFSTLSCCLLLCLNQVMLLPSLGGVLLAAVAFWRMDAVCKAGGSKARNAFALFLGWAFFFFVLAGPMFLAQYPVPSAAIVAGWCVGLMAGAVCRICRRWAVAVACAAVWMAYVLFAIPAWLDYSKGVKAAQKNRAEITKSVDASPQAVIEDSSL